MNARNQPNRRSLNCRRLLRGIAAPLVAAIMMALPSASFAGVYFSVDIAPPELPLYDQPPIPADGYIWTPGYWAYGDDGYFWVPGTWALAPYAGALWTPGYWDYSDDGEYVFNEGYWGLDIGFYGGVNYGYGYCGEGYQGGYWNNGALYYNTAVNNINITNINIYNRTVINNLTINNTTINDTTINNRTSFHGGPGGVIARPSRQDLIAEREQHTRPLPDQQRHVALASHNSNLLASVNHGAPPIAATQKPALFNGRGVVGAHPVGAQERGGGNNAAQTHPVNTPNNPAMSANNRGWMGGNPNALRSANFAPRTRDTQPSMPSDRTGSMAYPRNAEQRSPNSWRSSSVAPWAQGAQTGMQPRYAGSSANPREYRPHQTPFVPRNQDTAQRMQPASRDPSVYRREPPQVNYANETPRYQPATRAAQPYRDRPIERAPRQVATYQPARAPAPIYAPRPQAQPQPRATPHQQPTDPRNRNWGNQP